ncbi:hypothetical protein AKJ09_03573 [Labilithrix luteola]|uniref:Uncharacterized protein n=1 Tax=Labilithrix luteola TaxID=1391654 RepID=A0A0K1PUV0_9BACT|nr:hypothetical protein [Labilithrix luteola]AKU96909.1 hypothetical protein AKJ09_03573 [Labilithrix luteola]
MKRLLKAAQAVLGSLAVFIAVYVAYAHIASIAVAKRYTGDAVVERFGSASDLTQRYEIRKEGALAYTVSGGKLHVTGTTSMEAGKPARLELVGPVRSLEESRSTMRFRVLTPGAYDVMVGFETEHSGKGARAISYGLHAGPKASAFGWKGDPLTSLVGARVTQDLPDTLETVRDVPLASLRGAEGSDDGWHEVGVQFSNSLHQAFATIDGIPSGSVRSEWIAGLPVRLVFGVVARDPGQTVDVEIEEVVSEPVLPDPQALDFEDHFNGKVIDPRRWHVQKGDEFWMTSSALSSPKGLTLEGRALHVETSHAAIVLHTPPFPLGSVHVRARVQVIGFEHSGFFAGITTVLGGGHLRVFDGGFVDAISPEGKHELHRFAAGSWKHDGQIAFIPHGRIDGDEAIIEVDYDAKTRKGRIRVNGDEIVSETPDIQPRQEVRVRFGINHNEANSEFKVIVKELRLRALQD